MNLALETGVNVLNWARSKTLGLIEDIPEDKLCHQPIPDGNHALWVMGHLGWVDDYFLSVVGDRPAKPPETWQTLFGITSTPKPNPGDYPSPTELKEAMHHRREELIAFFKSMDADKLASPLPDDIKDFAANHATLMATLAWHEGLHAGQLTIIRKSLGIAPKFG